MLNNYEVNFKIKELIAAFFGFGEKNLEFFRKMNHVYELSSGRNSIYFILKDIEKKKGRGEIICPNYSCKAIPRAIIAAGFKPVFVDVDRSLSLDFKEVKKAITNNTKAIIFYHPWGFLHSRDIVRISKKHKIPLIEDCAQIIGKEVGNWGQYSFFSFRTGKVISVGTGAIVFSKEKIDIPLRKSSKFIGFIDFLDLIFRSKIKNYQKPRAVFERFEGDRHLHRPPLAVNRSFAVPDTVPALVYMIALVADDCIDHGAERVGAESITVSFVLEGIDQELQGIVV